VGYIATEDFISSFGNVPYILRVLMTKMTSILTHDPGSNPGNVNYDQNFYFEFDIVYYVFEGADDKNAIYFDHRPRFEYH